MTEPTIPARVVDITTGEVLDPPAAAAPLARRETTALAPLDLERELPAMFKLAGALAKAGNFIPRALAQAGEGAIVAAILTGRELGFGPMASIRSIHVIEGKATLSSEMLLALALRAGVRATWVESTADLAVLRLERGDSSFTGRFTMADAKRAGVTNKSNWQAYPAAMLRARCAAATVRAFCPDVATGMYATEEIETSNRVADMVPGEVLEQANAQAQARGHESAAAEASANRTEAERITAPWRLDLDILGADAKKARLTLNDASATPEAIEAAQQALDGCTLALDEWIAAHRDEYNDVRQTREGHAACVKVRARLSKIAALTGHVNPDSWLRAQLMDAEGAP